MKSEIKISRQVAVDDLGRIHRIYPKGERGLGVGNFEDGPKDAEGIMHVTGIYHIVRRQFTGFEAEEILEKESESQRIK